LPEIGEQRFEFCFILALVDELLDASRIWPSGRSFWRCVVSAHFRF
jgi:hypothetical protein